MRIVATVIAFALFTGPAVAADYVLTLQAVGYQDALATESDPEEAVLYSLEASATPGSKFHSKANIGSQELKLTGKLQPAKEDKFDVQVSFARAIDTGIRIPLEGGGTNPVMNESTLMTQVQIRVGESVELGGTDSKSTSPGQAATVSKTRFVLTLTKPDGEVN